MFSLGAPVNMMEMYFQASEIRLYDTLLLIYSCVLYGLKCEHTILIHHAYDCIKDYKYVTRDNKEYKNNLTGCFFTLT